MGAIIWIICIQYICGLYNLRIVIEYNEYIIKRMKKIIILQDHNGYTTTSLKNSGINKSVDANKIKGYLEKMGYQVCIVSLHTIDKNEFRRLYILSIKGRSRAVL